MYNQTKMAVNFWQNQPIYNSLEYLSMTMTVGTTTAEVGNLYRPPHTTNCNWTFNRQYTNSGTSINNSKWNTDSWWFQRTELLVDETGNWQWFRKLVHKKRAHTKSDRFYALQWQSTRPGSNWHDNAANVAKSPCEPHANERSWICKIILALLNKIVHWHPRIRT
jgi:hypothetical protein